MDRNVGAEEPTSQPPYGKLTYQTELGQDAHPHRARAVTVLCDPAGEQSTCLYEQIPRCGCDTASSSSITSSSPPSPQSGEACTTSHRTARPPRFPANAREHRRRHKMTGSFPRPPARLAGKCDEKLGNPQLRCGARPCPSHRVANHRCQRPQMKPGYNPLCWVRNQLSLALCEPFPWQEPD